MRSVKKQQKFTEIWKLLKTFDKDTIDQRSLELEEKLADFLTEYQRKSSKKHIYIGLYTPQHFEARLNNLHKQLLCDEHYVVYLVTNKKNSVEDVYQICDVNLKKLRCHDSPAKIAKKLNIVILPLIGFHQSGYRLGYGSGFFDKFLGKNKHIYSIGVGFKEQEIKTNIFTKNDVKLSLIMTA